MLPVRAASQASRASGSSMFSGMYRSPSGTTMWSLTHSESNPSSSMLLASRCCAAGSTKANACGTATPNLIAGTVLATRRHSSGSRSI